MDIIENNIDIKKMYKYQLENLNSTEYQKYLNFLNFYYSKETKKDKYTKKYLNGTYILTDKLNSSKEIVIMPSNFINIHILYIELKKYIEIILNKISVLVESKQNITNDHRQEFENLKEKYISFKNKLNDIDTINKDFYKEINDLFSEKIEKSNNLTKYYLKRVEEFNSIETMISEMLKNKLIKIYKNNNKKIPSISEINKIAKENLIPSSDIEKWFNWIESIYFYLLLKNNIYQINTDIEEKENTFDFHTRYMILRKPTIVE